MLEAYRYREKGSKYISRWCVGAGVVGFGAGTPRTQRRSQHTWSAPTLARHCELFSHGSGNSCAAACPGFGQTSFDDDDLPGGWGFFQFLKRWSSACYCHGVTVLMGKSLTRRATGIGIAYPWSPLENLYTYLPHRSFSLPGIQFSCFKN